jgi:RNA polymerase sigma-70 factor (ECF subfamily)
MPPTPRLTHLILNGYPERRHCRRIIASLTFQHAYGDGKLSQPPVLFPISVEGCPRLGTDKSLRYWCYTPLVQMSSHRDDVTQLLRRWAQGDRVALDELMPLIYGELHKLAKRQMRKQEPNYTLQASAIINEAYFRLSGNSNKDWDNRAHFFGVAAKAMRHVVVDHARTRRAAKRGGEVRIEQLIDGADLGESRSASMIALDDALTALTGQYPRQAEVVELRYFGGLSVEETARTLKLSPETVARDWRFAKAFLRSELEPRKMIEKT